MGVVVRADAAPPHRPPGTQEVVDGLLAALRPDIDYRVAHHEDLTWEPIVEVTEVTEAVALEQGAVRVIADTTDHRPVVPTNGYRIEHAGKAVVIAGDTVPCVGLDRLCAGADALVHTVIREDLIKNVPVQRLRDILDYHSSVADAARTAARGGVATLILTHYVPALSPGDEDAWRAIAAEHYDGVVELGDDLHTVLV